MFRLIFSRRPSPSKTRHPSFSLKTESCPPRVSAPLLAVGIMMPPLCPCSLSSLGFRVNPLNFTRILKLDKALALFFNILI